METRRGNNEGGISVRPDKKLQALVMVGVKPDGTPDRIYKTFEANEKNSGGSMDCRPQICIGTRRKLLSQEHNMETTAGSMVGNKKGYSPQDCRYLLKI